MAGRSLDRLGRDFSWSDFAAFVVFSPATSALRIAAQGEPVWSRSEQLLAGVIDALNMTAWAMKLSRTKPKPVYSPDRAKPFGSAAPVEDVRDFLVYRNGRAPEVM